MRVGIDVSPLVGTRAGVGTHVEHLVKALITLAPHHEYYLYAPEPLAETDAEWFRRFPTVKIIRSATVWLRLRTYRDRLDLFHGMNYKLRGWGRYGGVVTIHDLALDRVPQPSRKLFGQRWSFLRSRRTALRAARVIAVSRHTATDIAELYGVPSRRIAVIPNGAGAGFYPVTDRTLLDTVRTRHGIPPGDFLLTTGGAQPRKNAVGVVRAFAKLAEVRKDLRLVVVGGIDKQGDELRKTVANAGLQDSVVFPGHLQPEDLRALYSACSLFVFASLYEGFGMPLLEAMACGAPVICSNTSALPEVAGDAAILVSPQDPISIAAAATRLLSEPALREKLRRRGFAHVQKFSWERSAGALLKVYEELCHGPVRLAGNGAFRPEGAE